MTLTDEQAKQIKAQLLPQIAQLPADQQEQAKQYIESMNNEQLEQFLKQQQEQAKGQQPTTNPPQQAQSTTPQAPSRKQQECVFCALAKKQMPSVALYEDKDYLAALEIRPFSKAHTIIIPKKHIKQTKSIPSKALTLANKIGRHIIKKLKSEKAESFQVNTSSEMNHAIINIIPIYKGQPLTYQRQESKPEELQKLAIKIGEVPKRAAPKKKPKKSKETTNKDSGLPKYPRRIPR